jgi:hypothetical protein
VTARENTTNKLQYILEKAHKLLYEKYPQYQKISTGEYVIMCFHYIAANICTLHNVYGTIDII